MEHMRRATAYEINKNDPRFDVDSADIDRP
jgi:hypothetical protein